MLQALPVSWSTLSWQQLCDVWEQKVRYGGQPDAAIVAAWLRLSGLRPLCRHGNDPTTGEDIYILADDHGNRYSATPRQVAWYALKQMPWFHYPYGDPGQEEKKDKDGKVTQEQRDPHPGYVGPMRDALMLNSETVTVCRNKVWAGGTPNSHLLTPNFGKVFALPTVACTNLTWQQYRSLQATTTQLWREGIGDDETLDLQAQFLAHILVPRSLALLDQNGGTIRLRPHFTFRYDDERADRLVGYWRRRLSKGGMAVTTLFHVCHQVWQTALVYYKAAYPLLFEEGGSHGPMRDALQGEVDTINTIKKYAGFTTAEEVYAANVPFIMGFLNTMTKEAKEIERINSQAKKHKK